MSPDFKLYECHKYTVTWCENLLTTKGYRILFKFVSFFLKKHQPVVIRVETKFSNVNLFLPFGKIK